MSLVHIIILFTWLETKIILTIIYYEFTIYIYLYIHAKTGCIKIGLLYSKYTDNIIIQ